ncbi:MAG: hypothetical protein JWP91_2756 [Fibrobacteres bacterium]|nr:hypothetical protein [Fibrobacterota bacterium]
MKLLNPLSLWLAAVALAFWSCNVSEEGDGRQYISLLAPDTLQTFDTVLVIARDPATRLILDTLWNAPVKSSSDLIRLPIRNYSGGNVDVLILGFDQGFAEYGLQVEYRGGSGKPRTVPGLRLDSLPPALRLLGPDSLSLRVGEVLADTGAECTDDGGGKTRIRATGTVDAGTAGLYVIRYDCRDRDGNLSLPLIQKITVRLWPDTTQPAFLHAAPDSISLLAGGGYADPALECLDDRDGAIEPRRDGHLDMDAPGTYSLTYSCADKAGNAAEPWIRRILVARPRDTAAPVLLLRGPDSLNVIDGRPYADSGATCLDARDGILPVSVQGSVDVQTRNTYSLRYSCSDSACNAASVLYRRVKVERAPDPDKPVLLLKSADSITVFQGLPYNDSGATCLDARDGILPVSVQGAVDVQTRNTYSLRYSCSDSAGNAAEKTRRVKVVRLPDAVKPILALRGPDSVIVHDNEPYADSGATCLDDRDGALRVSVQGAVDVSRRGLYTLTYACEDSAGNAASALFRRVKVERVPDPDKPVLTLKAADSLTVFQGIPYADSGATCLDDRDGILPVSVQGAVDVQTRSTYSLRYSCSDSAGNAAEKTRKVKVVRLPDAVKPILALRGRDSVIVHDNEPYVDSGAICLDVRDGALNVSVQGAVDVSRRGLYTLTYACEDSAGNAASVLYRRVKVERAPDPDKPVLLLKGADSITVFQGLPYNDSGATCLDARDGILPVSVQGAVDVQTRNTYSLRYSCSDSAGNAAEKTRRIKVVRLPDAIKPILALRGRDSVIVHDNEPYVDSGATCLDDRDGPIPVLRQGSVDTRVRAHYTLVFQCSDSAGNQAQELKRVVSVERLPDPVKPILTLKGLDSLDVIQGTAYVDAGSSCVDDRDGPIPVTVTGSVDPSLRGLYALTFRCQDSAGNAAAEKVRKVKVIRKPDAVKPVLAMAGKAVMEHFIGTPYVDSGVTCLDDRDGPLPVATQGAVDPSTLATYSLRFDCADSAGNAADPAVRTVKVVTVLDLVKPVIALIGPDTMAVVDLNAFDNPGGTCADDRDGKLELKSAGFDPPAGPVNGIYRALYTCTDAAGNQAQASRVVKSGMYTVNLSAVKDGQIDTSTDYFNLGYQGVVSFSLYPDDVYASFAQFDLSKVEKNGLKSAKLHYFTWGTGDPWPGRWEDYTFRVYALHSSWVEGRGNWFWYDGDWKNGGDDWFQNYGYPAWVKDGSTNPGTPTGVTGAERYLVRDNNVSLVTAQKVTLHYDENQYSVPVAPPNRLVVVEIDVTDYVKNTDPAMHFGFMIKTQGTPDDRRIGWLTRELQDGLYAPRLMLSY